MLWIPRHIGGRDDHRRTERVAIAAARWLPRRATKSPRNNAISEISEFWRPHFMFPCSSSPPLPLLTTACQNPAKVLVRAPGFEFDWFRSAYCRVPYVHLRSAA